LLNVTYKHSLLSVVMLSVVEPILKVENPLGFIGAKHSAQRHSA
jgi:hypothetical protein